MYLEMREAGLPEPEYRTEAFMVYATIRNKKFLATNSDNVIDNTQDRILEYCKVRRSKGEIAVFLGYKDVKSFGKNHLKPLLVSHKLLMTIRMQM